MKKLKITVKMMLWNTLLAAVLLAVFLPLLYRGISISMYEHEKETIKESIDVVESIITFENKQIHISDKAKLPINTFISVRGDDGRLLYSNTEDDWFNTPQAEDGLPFSINHNENIYIIIEKKIHNEKASMSLRLCASTDSTKKALDHIFFNIFITVPILLLALVIGGLLVAKRALRPIRRITKLADEAGHGDLEKRISGVQSNDELGELAGTFNKMLDSLESSFKKEKSFVSDASHELRNPVAVIMANAESVLASPRQDDEIKNAARVILDESERMDAMISKLLMFTRGIDGKHPLKPEDVDVSVVIGAVMEQLQEAAEKKCISLVNQSNEIIVLADQGLITQLMMNLVSNSVKYGKTGGHVWVKTRQKNNKCIITVSDDGIGISPENISYIFDRFYRTDKARGREGNGLGLSIVKWIADVHGWEIEVESNPGRGTKFTVQI